MRAFSRLHFPVSSIAKYNPALCARSNSLLQNLTVYWKLEEASGTRYDSVGSADLTEATPVTQVPGLVGHAIYCDNTANVFLFSTSVALSLYAFDWSYILWAYFLDSANTYNVICKGVNDSDNNWVHYLLREATTGMLKFRLGYAGGGAVGINFDVGVIPDTTWTMIYFGYDASLDLMLGSLNAGSIVTNAFGQTLSTTQGLFRLGRFATYYCYAKLDEVGFWKRLLTPAELIHLYNSGSGRTYPL